MTKDLKQWLKDGDYLPGFLRDFHDQKDLFKFIHETYDLNGNDYTNKINWMEGQVYVIDFFLYIMAKGGYTLQKSRAKKEFVNLPEQIKKNINLQTEKFLNFYKNEVV